MGIDKSGEEMEEIQGVSGESGQADTIFLAALNPVSYTHLNIKHLAGEHVGGSAAAADDCSSCAENSGIRSLCPAKAKFHNAVALGCVADTGRFCGDQALMLSLIHILINTWKIS